MRIENHQHVYIRRQIVIKFKNLMKMALAFSYTPLTLMKMTLSIGWTNQMLCFALSLLCSNVLMHKTNEIRNIMS